MTQDNFSVNITQSEGIFQVYLNGYLDAHSAPQLETEIEKIIQGNNYKIIFEFSNLEYISSAGLGIFMTFIEEVRKNNGDIKLTNMTEKVKVIFDLLGFNMLFEIYPTLEEARAKFNS